MHLARQCLRQRRLTLRTRDSNFLAGSSPDTRSQLRYGAMAGARVDRHFRDAALMADNRRECPGSSNASRISRRVAIATRLRRSPLRFAAYRASRCSTWTLGPTRTGPSIHSSALPNRSWKPPFVWHGKPPRSSTCPATPGRIRGSERLTCARSSRSQRSR